MPSTDSFAVGDHVVIVRPSQYLRDRHGIKPGTDGLIHPGNSDTQHPWYAVSVPGRGIFKIKYEDLERFSREAWEQQTTTMMRDYRASDVIEPAETALDDEQIEATLEAFSVDLANVRLTWFIFGFLTALVSCGTTAAIVAAMT